MDETIAPTLYRTGRGDRWIPLVLAFGGLGTGGLVLGGSGPFWWPWGTAAAGVCAILSLAAIGRWWRARVEVAWDEAAGVVTVRRGRRTTVWPLADLRRLETKPSAARTRLVGPGGQVDLSHRLVRIEQLLDRVRALRPDLAPEPTHSLSLRVSWTDPVVLGLGLAAAAGAAVLVEPWSRGAAVVFALGLVGGLGRWLWFVPRRFDLKPGQVRVRYFARWKTWRGPATVREDAYAAGGAVFFRMRLQFAQGAVVLDEGHLVDPLRPQAGWIVRALAERPPERYI